MTEEEDFVFCCRILLLTLPCYVLIVSRLLLSKVAKNQ